MYYKPIYNENGININPDRNQYTTIYTCLECKNNYKVGTYKDRSKWWYIDIKIVDKENQCSIMMKNN